jgi:putative ubiquitin-RnfH superfamily antitoxin RatB of RatAB toxin-antitoxin module
MGKINQVAIEVAYARVDKQKIIACEVDSGCTVEEAIRQSGILAIFPEIDLERQKVGVFSKARKLSDVVKEGERIEIYRELTIDPKEARRAKAKLNRKPSPGAQRGERDR